MVENVCEIEDVVCFVAVLVLKGGEIVDWIVVGIFKIREGVVDVIWRVKCLLEFI